MKWQVCRTCGHRVPLKGYTYCPNCGQKFEGLTENTVRPHMNANYSQSNIPNIPEFVPRYKKDKGIKKMSQNLPYERNGYVPIQKQNKLNNSMTDANPLMNIANKRKHRKAPTIVLLSLVVLCVVIILIISLSKRVSQVEGLPQIPAYFSHEKESRDWKDESLNQFAGAMEKGDFFSMWEIYTNMSVIVKETARDQAKIFLEKALEQYNENPAQSILPPCIPGNEKYEVMLDSSEEILGSEIYKEWITQYISLFHSKENFKLAQEEEAKGNILEAILCYKLVIQEDSNYEEAKAISEKLVPQYRSELFAAAEKKADSGDYKGAADMLGEGYTLFNNDEEYQKKYEEYFNAAQGF